MRKLSAEFEIDAVLTFGALISSADIVAFHSMTLLSDLSSAQFIVILVLK
jgi:hypothetical protein